MDSKQNHKAFLFLLAFITGVSRILFLGKVPNSPGWEELMLLKKVGIEVPLGDLSFRYIMLPVSILAVILIYFLAYRMFKSREIAFCSGFLISLSPWFFLLTLFINPFIFILIIWVSFFLLVSSGVVRVTLSILTTFFLLFLLGIKPDLSPGLMESVHHLNEVFDLRNLFFLGDHLSTFARIPKTGHLLYADVLFLFIGLCFLLSSKKRGVFLSMGVGGIIFFLLYQNSVVPFFSSLLILLTLSLAVSYGFDRVWSFSTRSRLFNLGIKLLLIGLFFIQFFYYQNLLFFHFDKKNSSEWLYAEIETATYLQSENIQSIFITSGVSGSRLTFLLKGKKHIVPIDNPQKLLQRCGEKMSVCVVTQTVVEDEHVSPDRIKKIARVFSGLPVYFVIH